VLTAAPVGASCRCTPRSAAFRFAPDRGLVADIVARRFGGFSGLMRHGIS
jgi:hypothetical protein